MQALTMTKLETSTPCHNGARPTEKSKPPTLTALSKRCSYMAIESGVLVLKPRGEIAIQTWWLDDCSLHIINQIALRMGVKIFLYQSFSTGKYGRGKHDGVCLQFENLTNGKDAYAIFNVDLARKRNNKQSKKGDPLPGKQFSVAKKSAFRKFWITAGLKLPDRASKYSAYMGNLKSIVFTGEYQESDLKQERVNKQSLRPLSISYQELLNLINS